MNIAYYGHTVAYCEYLGEDSIGSNPYFANIYVNDTFCKNVIKIKLGRGSLDPGLSC